MSGVSNVQVWRSYDRQGPRSVRAYYWEFQMNGTVGAFCWTSAMHTKIAICELMECSFARRYAVLRCVPGSGWSSSPDWRRKK